MRLPPTSLIVLVGPAGAGKSSWAAANFRTDQIVSSDALRALVGYGEHDQRAGNDAFDLLDTVIDINPAKQGRYLAATGLVVQSPEEAMARLPAGTDVFVMNSNYLQEIEAMTALKLPQVKTKKSEVLTKHIAEEAKKDASTMVQVLRNWINEVDTTR